MPLDWRIDEENMVHLHHGVLHNGEENSDNLKFAGKWMDLENILSEVTPIQKDKYHMYSLISGF